MLTRQLRSTRRSYVPQGLRGKSIFGFCNAMCDLAEEFGTHSFRLDPNGPVEWEHVLATAVKRGLRVSSDDDGVITIRV
jgi:hypothetical protein